MGYQVKLAMAVLWVMLCGSFGDIYTSLVHCLHLDSMTYVPVSPPYTPQWHRKINTAFSRTTHSFSKFTLNNESRLPKMNSQHFQCVHYPMISKSRTLGYTTAIDTGRGATIPMLRQLNLSM